MEQPLAPSEVTNELHYPSGGYGGTAKSNMQSIISSNIQDNLGELTIAAPFLGVYNQPSLKQYASAPYSEGKTTIHYYSGKVAYAFALNFCLGVGVLGLPDQFNKTGFILAPIILFIVSILAFLNTVWILDTSARAEGLMRLMIIDDNQNIEENDTTPSLLMAQLKGDTNMYKIEPEFEITNRKFEVNQLVGMFLGRKLRRIYEFMTICHVIGACWSYTSVFGSAFAREIGIPFISNKCDISGSDDDVQCDQLYLFYVAIFAVLVIPLSIVDMSEQKYIQITMTLLRYVVIFTMSATAILLLYSYFIPNSEGGYDYKPNINTPNFGHGNKPMKLNGFITFIPVASFACAYQHGVPSLSQPVKHKQYLPFVYFSVSISCFLLFTLLGITVSLYFGNNVETPCTLSWGEFPGFKQNQLNKWWVYFIQYLIVLFPAGDVISAFPLNAVTLGNNMIAAFLSVKTASNKFYVILIRFICAFVPIVLACIVNDLGSILELAGTFVIFVCFFFPALIEYKSKKLCKRILMNPHGHKTPFTFWYCDDKILLFAMGFAIISFIASVYGTIDDMLSEEVPIDEIDD
eukprot:68981_1